LYPFVDVLGDGYSSFNYNEYLLLTSNNTIGLAGAAADGTTPVPATFSPDLEAYAFAPCDDKNKATEGEIYLNAFNNLSTTDPVVTTLYKPQKSLGPWPLHL
jgi:hypothetical protein